MKYKTVKNFTYEGLGFPVLLTNVPMVELKGEFVLDINFNKLQSAVLLHLCYKKTPLTGNEIRFIRKYFSLTTSAFANLFGYTHSAILKWENQKDKIARIIPTTEVYLRLYVLEFLQRGAEDFKELYDEISIPQLTSYLKKSAFIKYTPVSINAKKELMSAV